jgi:tryptophanyl-tRNA synthetase
MAHPDRIEDILQEGARKARMIATPFMHELRQAVGLRTLATAPAKQAGKSAKASVKGARYVSFRDQDSQFRFRLMGASGSELFCSVPFADPKQAGTVMRALQQQQADAVIKPVGEAGLDIVLDGQVVATAVSCADAAERDQLIASLRIAMQPEMIS